MKRLLWLSIVISIVFIAGCSNEKAEEQETEVEIEEEQDGHAPENENTDQEIDTEQKPPVFAMEDDNLVVYGLTLGDSPSVAEAIWGEPEILDEEPMGDADTYHYYPEVGMTIGYYDEKLSFIAVDAEVEDYEKITAAFKGDHLRNPEGDADFFLSPENGQLLIYGTANSVDGNSEIRLLMSDGNFFYYVDEGIYEKVEEVPEP